MRYERKYRIENQQYLQVLHAMKALPGAFTQAFADRWVNSIYLDNTDFRAMHENLSGVSDRSKYRLRWYGDHYQIIDKPILEEKIKHNLLGYKKNIGLENGEISADSLRQILQIPFLQDIGLYPVVMVRYLRTYLESYDHLVRITIDRSIEYRGVSSYSLDPFPIRDEAIILEIKYDQEIEADIDYILQSVKYRLTKNSKFVCGMFGYWG